MLEEIKKQLLDKPECIKELLEYFGYCNIVIRPNYMQFGRDEFSSKKSIVIRLDSKWLWVNDYARNIEKDIFGYIMQQRGVSFSDVLNVVKTVLHIDNFYYLTERKSAFGGFYNHIRKATQHEARTYDMHILERYPQVPNIKFLQDNISLEAQYFFNLRFDVESQTIVIPIYNQIGDLIGVKARCNYDVGDGEQKYYYHVPCAMSTTLYGYAQNYEYLQNNIVYVFESEKSVMQCYSYGIRNCVALGSGSLSTKQARMIHELHAKSVIFMHDVGFKFENVQRNITVLKMYSHFSEMQIGYWNYTNREYPDKVSPSDLGADTLQYIMDNEIQMIGDEKDEEGL